MQFNSTGITGVLVYLERKKTRQFVGRLSKKEVGFQFDYDNQYIKGRDIIPLGPELPFIKNSYYSEELFVSFADRIPSTKNPAYPEYCAAMGISVDETDPFILLSTIGKRGPSSFVFEPEYAEDVFTAKDFKSYREFLGLSVREFAICFQFSPSAVNRVENGLVSGSEILKRARLYERNPSVALDQIRRHGACLHPDKKNKILTLLLDDPSTSV